ncbi:hypothetical protein B9Z55_015637 [Caenorhabditis nigoni]|nr:hypothetical protein B9Z55_015637 [Caenorhabditis nigoni]
MKMIQIYGKVTYGPFPITYSSSTNCESACFKLDYCILSWQTPEGSCYHYSYLDQSDTISLVKTDKTEGSIVGFKTNITGTSCPISYTSMNFKMTIPTGDTYSWNKTGNSWSFDGCRDGWKRFDRIDGITVCMSAFKIPSLRRSHAPTWCSTQKNATIVGMASIEESQWVHGQLSSTYSYYAYWVDGTLTCKLDTCDYSTLNYTDGFTTGTAALNLTTNFLVRASGNSDQVMYLTVAVLREFAPKTMYPGSGGSAADGVVCGYQLKN